MKNARVSPPIDWQLGFSKTRDDAPGRWILASVPGAVQLDWARAEGWPPHTAGENSEAYRWMEDVWWTYRAVLQVPISEPGGVVRFVATGVDYRCEVFVDGRLAAEHEGLYSPVTADLTASGGNAVEIRIRIAPVPKSNRRADDRVQADHAFKPAVSYGWDFHPRLVPLGQCDQAQLRVLPALRFETIGVVGALLDDLSAARLGVEAELAGAPGARMLWTVLAPDGSVAFAAEAPAESDWIALSGRVDRPELWWPHDHGGQPLYTHVVSLVDAAGRVCDERRLRTGIRRVRLVMAPGQWERPAGGEFPKSRTTPPFTLEVNGRRIFAKGANWVAPDIFYGAVGRAEVEPLLRLARDSHFNLIRCWGGAPVMKDTFFDLADELGLLVWQEFTLACNAYPDAPDYLAVTDRESRFILRRLRHHPCIALWCGGNELFNKWSGMDDQSLALRTLDRNCLELDPLTPFLPTSPVDGVAHGHYIFRDATTGREVWELFQSSRYNAYPEFGVPGAANLDVIRAVIPESELWPPTPKGAWRHHHAFASWTDQHHLCLDTLQWYFGAIASLEQLVELSQWTQGEGLRGVFEEARRQKPRCSMALAWCFNEPWPAAANLSLVCWPASPKASLAPVGQACRPVLASARIARFQWRAGELFEAELWLLNDSPDPAGGAQIEAVLEADGKQTRLLRWDCPAAPANENVRGPSVRVVLPDLQADRFRLRLGVAGHPDWDSSYLLSFRAREAAPTADAGTAAGRPLNF